MSMYAASTCPTVRESACAYFHEGLSVIPLTGKEAKIKWSIYQEEVAIPQTINRWARTGVLNNVGIVCGKVSHNLVVVDLDGLSAIEAFEAKFPYLLNTFTVLTGSGAGKHLYYRVESLPPTTRISYPNHQGIELRADGCYVVAPPSLHPKTHAAYRPQSSEPIKELPHLEEVKRWLYAQLARKQAPASTTRQRTIGKNNLPRYVQAALDYECRDVRLAKEGSRNNQLFISARNIGQLVGDNLLPQASAETALLNAALQAGLNDAEAAATIRSGLIKGIAEPRSTQWQRRNK